MKRYLLILMAVLGTGAAWAGDSIAVVTDTVYTEARVIQYADTFKLQDQATTVDESALIWALLEKQGRAIHERDSIIEAARRDSLLAVEVAYRDSVRSALQLEDSILNETITALLARREALRDSLDRLTPPDTVEMAEEVIEVQIDSVQLAMDSLTYRLARENHISPAVIQRSIIKDAQADLEDINAALHQRKYWKRELNCLAHLTQNYATDNWYKGGNSSFSGLLQVKGFYNYEKDNLSWENNLDWKAGATTTGKTDTLRKVNVTDDMFRIQTKVGYQVVKKLYVSASMEFNTTLWTVWNTNKTTAKTAFMTPAKFYINGGVDYKPLKGLKLNVSPTVYRMVYAYWGKDPEKVDVTAYGIPAGEQVVNEFGSSIRLEWEFQPIREVTIDSDFYLYTSYAPRPAVEIDWEVTVDFVVNRFLTTRVTLHPRYDSKYIMEGDTKAKLQFKELISVGFAHKFR